MSSDEAPPGTSGPSARSPPATVDMDHILAIVRDQVAATITTALSDLRGSPGTPPIPPPDVTVPPTPPISGRHIILIYYMYLFTTGHPGTVTYHTM